MLWSINQKFTGLLSIKGVSRLATEFKFKPYGRQVAPPIRLLAYRIIQSVLTGAKDWAREEGSRRPFKEC